jgi:type I restriction enzyme S subunit
MKFLDLIQLNPKIKLEKGQEFPFVEMSNVNIYSREPQHVEIKKYTAGVKFQQWDTVVARIEPCLQNGKGFFAKDIYEGFGSTEFLVFRPKDERVNNKFLYYFMLTDGIRKNMISSMTGATGRQRVNNDIFKTLEISLPSIEKQKRISDILSTYDDLIENNQKQINLLEEAAMRLYKEWFVNLRFPGYETGKIVDSLPEGWEYKEVGSLITKMPRTKQVKTSEYKIIGKIPIIDQSRDFIAGFTDDSDTIVTSEVPVIVFGDHTRILKLISFPFAKGADGTQLIVSGAEEMPQYLFYCSLVNIDLSNYHYARHFKYLKATSIIVPTIDIAVKFENIIEPYFKAIQSLRDKIIRLQKGRDILLPKLMTNEIEV